MRKISFVLLINMIVISLFGQENFLLNDPFANFASHHKKIMVDSIHVKWYNNYESAEWTIEYEHSKDRVIDLRNSTIYQYYPNEFLKSEGSNCRTQCYYTNTGVDSLVNWVYNSVYNKYIPQTKTVVTYNSKGYIRSDYDYIIEKGDYSTLSDESIMEFDEKGRISSVVSNTNRDISPSIRKQTTKYYYLDDKRIIEVLHQFSHESEKEHPNDKSEYYYDEDGYQIKEIHYIWDEKEEYWKLHQAEERIYYCSSEVSNEKVHITSEIHIYSSSNNLIIDNPKNTCEVCIYDIMGKLITKKDICFGLNYISLEGGLYIIVIDGKTKKVKVKR